MQKLQIAYFCGFLRIFADYLRTFAFFFAYVLFVVWSMWGSTHCNVYSTTEKVACIFVIRGRSVGPCLNSGADEQEQYILCCKKMQNMLVSLIHGTEFIDLTLNVVPQAILITHV